MMISLVRTTSEHADFSSMVQLLDAELWQRYGDEQSLYAPHNKLVVDTVVLAYADGQLAGCGCFKPFSAGAIEIKRMFVASPLRGRGISKLILGELEAWALSSGYKEAVLETGDGQPEAIGLYQKTGYQQIDNYGPYKDLPNSICFSKKLS